MRPASGNQFTITAGDQQVTVVEVGGGIRSYRDGDRDVFDPYPRDQMCDGAHGTPLIPWPNRLGDGRYRFEDTDYQLALTEPDRSNAIHGLLRWQSWQPVEHDTDRIVMATSIHPRSGYPFALDVTIDYRLDGAGLSVATTATNVGPNACPYGCGQHPYLSPGPGTIDDATLQLAAATRIVTDPDRQLPTSRAPVAGSRYDFHTARRVGQLTVDDPFTDLARDAAGRAWVTLTGADGRTAALWVDENYHVIELYTGDTLAPHRRRRGLGTEPMTCPPNAFQTGEDLIRLDPGTSVTTTWGASLC